MFEATEGQLRFFIIIFYLSLILTPSAFGPSAELRHIIIPIFQHCVYLSTFVKVGTIPDYTDLSSSEAQELKDADRSRQPMFVASTTTGIKASTTVPRKQRPKPAADLYSLDDLYINTDSVSQVYENEELQPRASVSVKHAIFPYLKALVVFTSLFSLAHCRHYTPWAIKTCHFYFYVTSANVDRMKRCTVEHSTFTR